ncbi:BofC C-terminal domain-containing protein [Halanaerobaculum tunisiense]
MKVIKSILAIVAFIFLVAVITYLGLNGLQVSGSDYFFGLDSKTDNEPEQSKELKDLVKKEQQKLNQRQSDQRQVDVDTELILKQVNSLEEEKILTHQQTDDSLVGLSQEELANQLTTGEITQFSPQKVVIEVKKEQQTQQPPKLQDIIDTDQNSESEEDSSQESNNLYLGIKDGYVAVYRGEVLGEHEVVEIRKDIRVEDLSQQDLKELQLGIKVESREEMLSYLEGLASATN